MTWTPSSMHLSRIYHRPILIKIAYVLYRLWRCFSTFLLLFREFTYLFTVLHFLVVEATVKNMNNKLVPMILQLLLLLLIDVIMTSAQRDTVQVTSFRKPRKILNDTGMCALDTANETILSSSLQECSLVCTRDGTCAAFNTKNSNTICDLYNYRPKVNAPVSDCKNYQVGSQWRLTQ